MRVSSWIRPSKQVDFAGVCGVCSHRPWRKHLDRARFLLRPGETGPTEAKWDTVSKVT